LTTQRRPVRVNLGQRPQKHVSRAFLELIFGIRQILVDDLVGNGMHPLTGIPKLPAANEPVKIQKPEPIHDVFLREVEGSCKAVLLIVTQGFQAVD
jgi:hypothetical protein